MEILMEIRCPGPQPHRHQRLHGAREGEPRLVLLRRARRGGLQPAAGWVRTSGRPGVIFGVIHADARPAFRHTLLHGGHSLLGRRDALNCAHAWHVVTVGAAQQLIYRHTEVLPFEVVQGDVDGRHCGRQRAPALEYRDARGQWTDGTSARGRV